jgi:phosphohistidine phosphatase
MARLRLYFLRHGKALPRAEWRDDDDLRPLTSEGEAEIRRLGSRLAALEVRPGLIVSSPLTRARRTAELVAEALGMPTDVVLDERLAHGFGHAALAAIAAQHRSRGAVLLVGHEPDFSATIGGLVGGARVVCKKGGLARVDVDEETLGGGELVWLVPPAFLARE